MNKNKNFFAELKQNIADEKKNLAEKEVEPTLLKKNTFEQGLNLTGRLCPVAK